MSITYFVGIDTALQNSGIAVLDAQGCPIFLGKPFDPHDPKLAKMSRVIAVRDYIRNVIERLGTGSPAPVFVAFEDWLMSPYVTAYETAELIGVIKAYCIDSKIPYAIVHPGKTKKFVRKAKKVEKQEIIDFWDQRIREAFPAALPLWEKLPKARAPRSDIADALSIAEIGRMTWGQALCRDESILEDRHAEIIWRDQSGILTKPGLVRIPSED